MHETNWNDLKFVLAVADTGSVARAAKALGVAHTTVLRRIAAFETETGARIFERTARGYQLAPDKINALDKLRAAGAAVKRARAEIDASVVAPGEVLRVTSTDMLCAKLMPDVLEELCAENPSLQVALLSTNVYLDLAHSHADLTIRPTEALPDDLIGEKAAHLGMTAYSKKGAPDIWVGVTGPLVRSVAGKWLFDREQKSHLLADSFIVLSELLASGAGKSILPCILGDSHPELVRISGEVPVVSVPIWVANHRDLGDSRRIRKFRRQMARAIARHASALLGDRSVQK